MTPATRASSGPEEPAAASSAALPERSTQEGAEVAPPTPATPEAPPAVTGAPVEPEQEIIDLTQNEPTPAASKVYSTREKSIKRKQEDTKTLLAMTLTLIVLGVMVGGWWGWMQGKDLQEFATFTVPVFTLAAAALAFYDRGKSR